MALQDIIGLGPRLICLYVREPFPDEASREHIGPQGSDRSYVPGCKMQRSSDHCDFTIVTGSYKSASGTTIISGCTTATRGGPVNTGFAQIHGDKSVSLSLLGEASRKPLTQRRVFEHHTQFLDNAAVAQAPRLPHIGKHSGRQPLGGLGQRDLRRRCQEPTPCFSVA